jgi:hypothetical protein
VNVAAAHPPAETQALQHWTLLFAYTFHMALLDPPYDWPDVYEQALPRPFGVMDCSDSELLKESAFEYN